MLLNHVPGSEPPAPSAVGRGPRYFRFQTVLEEAVALDDARERVLTDLLPRAAGTLIASHDAELDEIVDRLIAAGPLEADPGR
jgi:hypothetical protein